MNITNKHSSRIYVSKFEWGDIMIKKMVIILILCLSVTFIIAAASSAQGELVSPDKSYMTIQVERSDTLWDIATRYMNDHYYDYDSYIEEICSINHLSNDKIYAGETLIIPVVK